MFETCNIVWKLPKNTLYQRTFLNLQSHLACWHIPKCVYILIKHTICENLVKIQLFRHEWLSIIPKKRNKINEHSITCSYICHINTSKCAYWLDTHSVKVWWRYVLANTNAVHFCDNFFRHRAMFSTCPISLKNPATLG